MTTIDIGNNLKQIIFLVVIVLGCGALAIKGYTTNDITTIIGSVVGAGAAIKLAGSDKISLDSGGNEQGNEKSE